MYECWLGSCLFLGKTLEKSVPHDTRKSFMGGSKNDRSAALYIGRLELNWHYFLAVYPLGSEEALLYIFCILNKKQNVVTQLLVMSSYTVHNVFILTKVASV